MNHADIQNHMADYLEGDLPLGRRALFDAHLDSCPACSGELGEMRAMIGALKSIPSPEAPPFLVEKVMRRIRAGEGKVEWWDYVASWGRQLLRPQLAIPATAMATAAIVLVMTGQIDVAVPGLSSPGPQIAETKQAPVREIPEFRVSIQLAGAEPVAMPEGAVGLTFSSRGTAGSNAVANPWRSAGLGPEPIMVHGPSGSLNQGGSALEFVSDTRTLGRSAFEPHSGSRRSGRTPGWERALAPVSSVSLAATGDRDRPELLLDERLMRLQRAPLRFARRQAQLSFAEQELWARQMSLRAQELGVLDDLTRALRETADPQGIALADALSAATEGSEATSSGNP